MEFNKLVPELSVANLDKSLKFYIDILGFKKEYERKELKFAFLSFQGSQLMLEEINNHWDTGKLQYPFGRGINFQIEVDSIINILNKIKKSNYPLFKDVEEKQYKVNNNLIKVKEFLVQDPDGYLLRFSQEIK
jgi:catechol 2,3-dioxygenase-like lactoylglutathione lyase family enzyme